MSFFEKWTFIKSALQQYLQFEVVGIVFGEVRANLNDQYPLSGAVLLAYLPEAQRNKTGVLRRVC